MRNRGIFSLKWICDTYLIYSVNEAKTLARQIVFTTPGIWLTRSVVFVFGDALGRGRDGDLSEATLAVLATSA